uniref:hypothetical protein n=1 Tax=Escherichia coli TaxID=562 RepID=UPI0022B84419|nr:hypothetical protein [Escherichia coli]WAK47155.1 hypothetical protein PPOKNCAL_00799 [Escherichia coli]
MVRQKCSGIRRSYLGFGWLTAGDLHDRNRDKPTKELESLILGLSSATLRINLENGLYIVSVYIGDTLHDNHITKVSINQNINFEAKSKLGVYYKYNFCIQVDNGKIELSFDSPVNNWIVNSLEINNCNDYFESVKRDVIYHTDSQWGRSNKGIYKNYCSFYSSEISDIPLPPTEVSRDDYLQTIKDGVLYFRKYQNKSGAIIDPYLQAEFQYSTPFYAYCSALIARESKDSDLLKSSILSFEWALDALVNKTAATRHEDFFPSPLAHAFNILKSLVNDDQRLAWEEKFLSIKPFETYRHVVGGSGSDGSNWNCKALTGEWLLYTQGLRDNIDFLTHSLNLQGRFFKNHFDLYAEGPFVYDIFPRAWLYDLLEHGYDGELKDIIGHTLDSAALASMFMQSSSGLLPLGGRSGLHIWGDTLQILLFEIAAKRSIRSGDTKQAGMFKRSAHNSYKTICTWKNEESILPIVRNKCSSHLRHGFEGYSSHTQYGLLTLGILGYSWEHAEESEHIKEFATPAEVGSYFIDLPSPFHTIIASCAGTSIQIHRNKIKGQNPIGLNKISFKGIFPTLPMMDVFVSNRHYHLAFDIFDKDCSLTIQWIDFNGEIKQISDYDEKTFENKITNLVVKDNCISFENNYSSDLISFCIHYMISEYGVALTFKCKDKNIKSRFTTPIFSSNGKDRSIIKCSSRKINVTFENSTIYYSTSERISIGQKDYGFRGGTFSIAHTAFNTHEQTLFVSRYE